MTKPEARWSKGQLSSADRAPILQNLTKDCGDMLESTPPVTTIW